MSTNDRFDSGFHGPPPSVSEVDDRALAEFAAEWDGDVAEEAPCEADAHRTFDHEAVPIEEIEPEPDDPDDRERQPRARRRSMAPWLMAVAPAIVIVALGSIALHYARESNRLKQSARVAPAPPDLVRPSAERKGGQSAPSAESRPAAAPISSSSAKATEDKAFAKVEGDRSARPTVNKSPRVAVAPQPPLQVPAPSIESPATVALPMPDPEPPLARNHEGAAAPPLEPLNLRETEIAQHRIAIRELLDAYRQSYDRLDAVSAARLWPGVDTAALSRAFSTLSSQAVEFDSCTLDLDVPAGARYQRATALCSGSVTYRRRVGNASPQSRALAWTFELDRSSGQWLIRRVVAR